MKLAIFDFDGTMFPNDTLAFLLSEWKKQGYSKKKYYNTIIPVVFLYLKIQDRNEVEIYKRRDASDRNGSIQSNFHRHVSGRGQSLLG